VLGLGCGVWGISTCPPRRERGAITEDRAGGEVPADPWVWAFPCGRHFCDLSCGTGGARSA
jgi:hypothetical protein